MANNTRNDTPVPRWFYVNDDVSGRVLEIYGSDSSAWGLVQRLFTLLRKDLGRVFVLTLED